MQRMTGGTFSQMDAQPPVPADPYRSSSLAFGQTVDGNDEAEVVAIQARSTLGNLQRGRLLVQRFGYQSFEDLTRNMAIPTRSHCPKPRREFLHIGQFRT